jgi:hypothetical protein
MRILREMMQNAENADFADLADSAKEAFSLSISIRYLIKLRNTGHGKPVRNYDHS